MDKSKLKELFGDAKNISDINEIVKDMKKNLIELFYEEELKEHLGFSKSENKEGGRENHRNGSYSKSVKSQDGIIELNVPRDRNGEYEPQIIPKYKGDIFGIEDKIIGLYGLGMSTRDISDHIKEIYDFDVSESTVSNITNKVLTEAKEWQSRALKEKYAVVFLDGMVYKVKKEGVIQKVTAYIVVGIDMDGYKDVLGLYLGGFESSKYWLTVLNELKTRGVKEIMIFCTDNLTGLDDAIKSTYKNADHQKCIVHQIRNSVKHVSYKDLKEVCKDMKKIYTSVNADIALNNLEDFCDKWDKKYSYIGKSWRANWCYLTTFWKYPSEIRKMIYTTNPIEGFNRHMRKITKTKSSFPSEDALLKSLYLGIKNVEKKFLTKIRDWGIIYSQLLIMEQNDEELNNG
jgi:transposase-like protein